MRRMTLDRIRLRRRLLPRFRRLAFESLYDRITLDASLPEFIADGEVLPEEETVADSTSEEYVGAADGDEGVEVIECVPVAGEEETASGEPIEWELLTLEEYDESSEQWDDGYEETSDGDGEFIEGELVDPIVWETGESEESVMYSFTTGVIEEDAGEGVSDSGDAEPLPEEESVETAEDKAAEEAPPEDYVVSAEGEHLPLSAVQRTLNDLDAPQTMTGGMEEIFETTIVEESLDGILVESVPESSDGMIEIADFFEPAEVIESAPVLEATDGVEFMLAEASIVEVDALEAMDLQTFAPSIAVTSVMEIASFDVGLGDVVVNAPTSARAPDPSGALQLATTPSNSETQEDESDESTSIRKSLAPLTTAAATVTSEEDEETDGLPADDVEAEEDEEALAEVAEGAADAVAE